MQTKYKKVQDNEKESIDMAVSLLQSEEVVAIPTETVYGLAANGLSTEACRKIFEAKGRPSDNPLILHISHIDELDRLVFQEEYATLLEAKLWPGPLTLIFKRKPIVPDIVTAGGETVAIRMPAHRIANRIIRECGFPLAAPSANRSGRPSPTNGGDVLEDMQGRIAAVIDGGDSNIGIESTVVDLTVSPPKILRPGYYTLDDLQIYLPDIEMDSGLIKAGQIPKSPGQKYKHYAPKADVEVYFGERDAVHKQIKKRQQELSHCGLLLFEDSMECFQGEKLSLGNRNNLLLMGKHLFSYLREMDRRGVDNILIEFEKKPGFGESLYNRLLKASGGKIYEVRS